MLRLAAGSCSREIRPLLLAFQLHFTAPHICCESYFSAFSPQANTALLWLHWLSLTAQPPSSFFIHNKFRLSSSLASLCPLFVIYLFGLFNSEGSRGWTDDRDAAEAKKRKAEWYTIQGWETQRGGKKEGDVASRDGDSHKETGDNYTAVINMGGGQKVTER